MHSGQYIISISIFYLSIVDNNHHIHIKVTKLNKLSCYFRFSGVSYLNTIAGDLNRGHEKSCVWLCWYQYTYTDPIPTH